MPSLPSLPGFEDSQSSEDLDAISDADDSSQNLHQPIHSTPALSSHYSSSTASRVPSSTASTQRFATSIGRPRSSSGQSLFKANRSYSFDISAIPSLPDVQFERGTHHFSDDEEEGDPLAQSKDSVPEVYLPPDEEDDDLSFSDRSDSPQLPVQPTPRKYFDTTAPLRSEPKVTPSSFPIVTCYLLSHSHHHWILTGILPSAALFREHERHPCRAQRSLQHHPQPTLLPKARVQLIDHWPRLRLVIIPHIHIALLLRQHPQPYHYHGRILHPLLYVMMLHIVSASTSQIATLRLTPMILWTSPTRTSHRCTKGKTNQRSTIPINNIPRTAETQHFPPMVKT